MIQQQLVYAVRVHRQHQPPTAGVPCSHIRQPQPPTAGVPCSRIRQHQPPTVCVSYSRTMQHRQQQFVYLVQVHRQHQPPAASVPCPHTRPSATATGVSYSRNNINHQQLTYLFHVATATCVSRSRTRQHYPPAFYGVLIADVLGNITHLQLVYLVYVSLDQFRRVRGRDHTRGRQLCGQRRREGITFGVPLLSVSLLIKVVLEVPAHVGLMTCRARPRN